MNVLSRPSWSPYAVGAGIGALNVLAVLTAKKPIGITTPFESTAAGLGQQLAPRASGANAYLARNDEVPRIDWEWMLAAGVMVGSLLSARSSGATAGSQVPALWTRRFGPSPLRRDLGAFLGGALMMFGARMAKGCTSGHAISGTMQLAGSSWLFSPLMAVTAAVVSRALFGKASSHAG